MPGSKKSRPLAWLKPAVLVGSFVPFIVLAGRAVTGGLGANPIETALNQLGLLGLIFLLASLACTPFKLVLGWNWPLRVRKLLGLLGFFTVLAHFLVYLVLDQGLALGAVFADVFERPFILVGFSAFVLLIPLAATSTRSGLKKLGFKRWKWLHRLAYVIAVLGVVHFYMRVKADTTEPLVYGAVLVALLLPRVVDALRERERARQRRLFDVGASD